MLVTRRKCFGINHVSFSSTMVNGQNILRSPYPSTPLAIVKRRLGERETVILQNLSRIRDGETTIQIKFAFLRWGGTGGRKMSKTFFFFFLSRWKRYDNTNLNVQVPCREILLCHCTGSYRNCLSRKVVPQNLSRNCLF